MYVGKIVWNRQPFVKDPDTGKRQARPNPEEEWVIQDVPELRILDDELWEAVKARQAENRIARDENGQADVAAVHRCRRPKYLFSGLTKCACCGGGYSAISATLIGCSTARNKGTCDNRVNIRRDELESRVLNALRTRLVDPALFAKVCQVFTQEVNRLRMEGRANVAAAEAEIRKIDRELDTLHDLILKGGAADRINAKMVGLEQRKKEVEAFLATADEPPPLLHPSDGAAPPLARPGSLRRPAGRGRGEADRSRRYHQDAGRGHRPDAGGRQGGDRRTWRSRWNPCTFRPNKKPRLGGGVIASKDGCGGRI
ncbi:recombinase zinc beta ribbon domain-containing protein [Stappia sp. ES.058]|uniref:recombinase zinc beta ribbon domain-containing protein n=1 Tax=Stappia sp. ES.058 TaxID=1881061 RepID=UPI0018D346B5|nr:recombinase zinc beta ribbon domain-containing protein [Stappia sp. ES.058]